MAQPYIDKAFALLPEQVSGPLHWLSLDHPLNLVLLLILAQSIYTLVQPPLPTIPLPSSLPAEPSKSYNWRLKEHAQPVVWQRWTPKELAVFDGAQKEGEKGEKEEGKLLMAIRGKVYDVSGGKSFYGPGGPYANFGGRDASRGLAKQSFEADMLTDLDKPIDTLTDLTPSEWENLKGWESHFQNKYILCGDFVEA